METVRVGDVGNADQDPPGDLLARLRFFPLPPGHVIGAAVLDPPAGDLGRQRCRHAAQGTGNGAQPPRHPIGGDHVTDPEARRQTFRQAGNEITGLGGHGGEGRRPVCRQESVYVVFDDGDVMAAGDIDDFLAAVFGHDGGNGVLQRGHAVEGLGLIVAAGLFEGVRAQAIAVHGHADKTKLEKTGQFPQPRIGQFLGQHHIAGAGEGHEGDRHPMLRAVAHGHPLGGRGQAGAGNPPGGGFPVAPHAHIGLVIHE